MNYINKELIFLIITFTSSSYYLYPKSFVLVASFILFFGHVLLFGYDLNLKVK